ncbi:hypothetical protein LXA43DRAFT_1104988 [Ganoderma leucocontextum]|nr:hypothetical protein LXA43DRAFT_1104988 [Ganoderma leucocontextum]
MFSRSSTAFRISMPIPARHRPAQLSGPTRSIAIPVTSTPRSLSCSRKDKDRSTHVAETIYMRVIDFELEAGLPSRAIQAREGVRGFGDFQHAEGCFERGTEHGVENDFYRLGRTSTLPAFVAHIDPITAYSFHDVFFPPPVDDRELHHDQQPK